MTRVAFEISEPDALLIENAARRERMRPEQLMAEVLSQFCDARRELLRRGDAEDRVVRSLVEPAPPNPNGLPIPDEVVKAMRFRMDQGLGDGVIARQLGLPRSTVQWHRWKYNAQNRADLIEDMHAEDMRKEKGE